MWAQKSHVNDFPLPRGVPHQNFGENWLVFTQKRELINEGLNDVWEKRNSIRNRKTKYQHAKKASRNTILVMWHEVVINGSSS